MPFISTVRGNFGPLKKTQVAGDPELKFRITGGNSINVTGGYRIHTFSSSGQTFNTTNFQAPLTTEYLVIAGGASGSGGGLNGGGGAGGYRQSSNIFAVGSQTVTVGSGGATPGAAYQPGQSGQPSTYNGITSTGGGGGGSWGGPYQGLPGGSGGGGAAGDAPRHTSAGGGGRRRRGRTSTRRCPTGPTTSARHRHTRPGQ